MNEIKFKQPLQISTGLSDLGFDLENLKHKFMQSIWDSQQKYNLKQELNYLSLKHKIELYFVETSEFSVDIRMQLKPVILQQRELDEVWYHVNNNYKIENVERFLPFAYRLYPMYDVVNLFIFNSDGSIFKHGHCKISELYDYHAGKERLKPFENILEIQLYYNIKLSIKQGEQNIK